MPDNSNLWSQALSDPNQAAMQPETFSNPLVKKHVADVANLLGMPGRAYSSTEPIPSEQMVGPAFEIAKQFGMLGLPMAKPGTAGIMGGRLAHTANMDKLEAAEAMANQGKLPHEIALDTGWHRSPADYEWRFEIPDNRAAMTYMPVGEGDAVKGPLSAFFRHPDAFKAYPDFANINLNLTRDARFPQGNGGWNPNTNTIDVLAPDARTARSVTLHELQHAVQKKEDFSPGSSPGYLAGLIETGVKKSNPDYSKIYDYEGIRKAANDIYHKTAGEVEARNVMSRADFSPAERKINYPWNTQDVPYADQYHFNHSNLAITPVPEQAQLLAQALKNK
jgi:hypothetical protein